jgi:hypothetical protein
MEIRDPLHGSIRLTPEEIRVLDHPLVQRLRSIRQLGFASLSFPGATHTRYLHSLGALHLAGRAFDAIVDAGTFAPPAAERARLRALVRLAALLHDVGHPPLSHTTESALPTVGSLGVAGHARPADEQATHEDLTVALILDDDLGAVIDATYRHHALDRRLVAATIVPAVTADPAAFRVGGADARPLLHQVISSELDVDRMDYLLRDAYFAGVGYGTFDREWLLSGLSAVVDDGRWHLALDRRAVMAFEDFLLSRYHMFLAVYFHHRTIVFDYMLKQWFASQNRDPAAPRFVVPTAAAAYARFDDHALEAALRDSDDRWAQRIVARRALRLVRELRGREIEAQRPAVDERLAAAGVEAHWVSSTSTVSKYYRKLRRADPWTRLFTRDGRSASAPVPLHETTDLFHKYEEGYRLLRLYAAQDQVAVAEAALSP